VNMKDVDVEEMDDDSERKLFDQRHLLDGGAKPSNNNPYNKS